MSGAASVRTTSTAWPWPTRPAASAAENVAIPHGVGGNVERMANRRDRRRFESVDAPIEVEVAATSS
jgi:hypothetical protein